MKIPKSVKIKRSTWKILLDDTKFDTGKYSGLCIHNHKEILIDPNLPRNDLEETFIHEILHACFPVNTCSFDKEEEVVWKLAKTLTPVFRDLLKNEQRRKPKKRANRKHR